jgi:hypothetical protein
VSIPFSPLFDGPHHSTSGVDERMQNVVVTSDAKHSLRSGPERFAAPTAYDRRAFERLASAAADGMLDDARPVRGGAIQALNRDVLIGRSLEVSSTGFLTIISIIQGVALALLAQNTFADPSALVYLQSITLLLVFVSVFYYYVAMSILFRWAPSFLDSFLPFGIASLEIPPAFFLGHPAAWNAWLAAFWLFTSGGLYITIKWSPQSHFGTDRKSHRLAHRFLHELKLTAAAGGFLMAVLGLFAHLDSRHQLWWGSAGAAATLAAVAMVVARTEIRLSQIHERYGVNRPPFN